MGIFSHELHGQLRARSTVATALIVWNDVSIITDFSDDVIDDAIPAALGGATIRAAAIAIDLIPIVARFSLIEKPIATAALNADTLLRGRCHAGRAGYDI